MRIYGQVNEISNHLFTKATRELLAGIEAEGPYTSNVPRAAQSLILRHRAWVHRTALMSPKLAEWREIFRLDATRRTLVGDINAAARMFDFCCHEWAKYEAPHSFRDYTSFLAWRQSGKEALWFAEANRNVLSNSDAYELMSESQLTEATVARSGVWTERSLHMLAAMRGINLSAEHRTGLVFPYFLPSHTPHSARLKDSQSGYRQRRGETSRIYFPTNTRENGGLIDQTTLVWTEGEKKALYLDQIGFSAVGLPGVWMAHDVERRREEKSEFILHPWIREHVLVAGRRHVIAFDPAVSVDGQVRDAARRLAEMLRTAGAADVRVVRWPNDLDCWVDGVDDLAENSGELAVRQLIAGARSLPVGVSIPLRMIESRELKWTELLVFGALIGRASLDGSVQAVPMRFLGRQIGRERQSVGRALRRLEELGLIGRLLGKAQKHNDRFRRDPDAYQVREHSAELECTWVHPNDVRLPHGATVMLSVIREAGPISSKALRSRLRVPPRTLRDWLNQAGGRLERVGDTVSLRDQFYVPR